MATASLKTVLAELKRRGFSVPSDTGVVCRPKKINGVSRPDKGWSQHSWGNAIDLNQYNGISQQRPVVAALESMRLQGFPVGLILWASNRPSDHSGHIHLEGSPSRTGVPPCAGGKKLSEDLTNDELFEERARLNEEEAAGSNIVSDFVLGLFGLEQADLGDIGIRIVFGLLAVLAAAGTLLLVVNAFKGNIAGTLIGEVKDVVS